MKKQKKTTVTAAIALANTAVIDLSCIKPEPIAEVGAEVTNAHSTFTVKDLAAEVGLNAVEANGAVQGMLADNMIEKMGTRPAASATGKGRSSNVYRKIDGVDFKIPVGEFTVKILASQKSLNPAEANGHVKHLLKLGKIEKVGTRPAESATGKGRSSNVYMAVQN